MRFVVEQTGRKDYGTIVQDTDLIVKTMDQWDVDGFAAAFLDSSIKDSIDRTSRIDDSKNVKAHHSDWKFFEQSQSVSIVCNQAVSFVKSIVSEESNMNWDINLEEGWGIKYERGDSTRKHSHFPHSWSFVYMVSGCDQCSPLDLYAIPDESLKKLFNYTFERHEITFEPGKMVIFPGWVNHEVKEHTCDHARYAVAGNISQKTADCSGRIINVDGYISGIER